MNFLSLLLTFLSSILLLPKCFGAILYEKPKSPSYSVGETIIESVLKIYSGFNVVSTETSFLNKIETFSGNDYNHWLTTIRTTSPTNSTTTSRRYADKLGTFVVMNSDTSDNAGLAVYKTLQNNLGNKFKVGDTILDSTSFFNTTILYEGVTSSGYGITAIRGTLNGVEYVNTNIGVLECYSIEISAETAIKFGNAINNEFQLTRSETGTIWQSNVYGRVKSKVQVTEVIEDDGIKESTIYGEERMIISAPSRSSTGVIATYSSSEQDESLQNNMGGWMWMGSLPWIYNATTESWGYLANNEIFLWDSGQSSWLTFDKVSQTWSVSAN